MAVPQLLQPTPPLQSDLKEHSGTAVNAAHPHCPETAATDCSAASETQSEHFLWPESTWLAAGCTQRSGQVLADSGPVATLTAKQVQRLLQQHLAGTYVRLRSKCAPCLISFHDMIACACSMSVVWCLRTL